MKYVKTSLHFINYLLILLILWPISLLSYKRIHRLASMLSNLVIKIPFIKKRIYSNLAIALNLNHHLMHKTARASLTRLITTLLEFLKINREKNIDRIVTCTNAKLIDDLIAKNEGAVVFCSHLGNWEMMLLERSRSMHSVGVGRPLKNPFIYKLITKVRQRFNTKMVPPKGALKECLKALKSNKFVGLASDQAYLEEGIETRFFNQTVLSSPAAATLAYKTNKPLIVMTNVCVNGHYYTKFHPPIYKDEELERSTSIKAMTQKALEYLEKEIREHPDQYLWLHNRFKRKCGTKRKYRSERNLLLLSPNTLEKHRESLKTIAEVYPNSINHLYIHKDESHNAPNLFYIKSYNCMSELFFTDFSFKLLFNFTNNKDLSNHFLKQSITRVLDQSNLNTIHNQNNA